MTESTRHLTTRVPVPLIEQLDEMAHKRRKASGLIVHRADLVREAVERLIRDEIERDRIEETDYGCVMLDVLEGLSSLTSEKGLDDAQEMVAAIRSTAEQDPRLNHLRAFARRLSDALGEA